jgi:hypothetical protein
MSKYPEIDLRKIKTLSVLRRKSKVEVGEFGKPAPAGCTFRTFWDGLPRILAVREMDELVDRIVRGREAGKPILWMMGAHVIKVGLSPLVIDLVEEGLVQGMALNGAGAIHDVELAYFGTTSEDVVASLKDGRFGMSRETAELLNGTARQAQTEGLGFGEALGKRIVTERPPHGELSILGRAYQMGVPVTVHVALGTDIVHQHPSADGAAIGECTLRDFRIWAHGVSKIHHGGVVLLFGSTVVLPEVFLKSLTVARNVNGPVKNFTTASFDMIRHYRPRVNVVERPTAGDGKGFSFIGHHEIMMPLLAQALKERRKVQGI